jgi:hypothetical protein
LRQFQRCLLRPAPECQALELGDLVLEKQDESLLVLDHRDQHAGQRKQLIIVGGQVFGIEVHASIITTFSNVALQKRLFSWRF